MTDDQPASSGGTATTHPTPDDMVEVANGTAAPALRLTVMDHVKRCEACRRDLEQLRGPQPKIMPLSRPFLSRPAMIGLGILIVIVAIALWFSSRGGSAPPATPTP